MELDPQKRALLIASLAIALGAGLALVTRTHDQAQPAAAPALPSFGRALRVEPSPSPSILNVTSSALLTTTSSATAPSATSSARVSDIRLRREAEKYLADDDVCALLKSKVLTRLSNFDLAALVRAGRDTFDYGVDENRAFASILEASVAPDAASARISLGGSAQEAPSFFGALIDAGAYEAGPIGTDPSEAIRQLERLARIDPDNGAYPYFLAGIKSREGYAASEVREDFERAFAAPRFRTYMRELAQRVLEKGLESPSRYLAATTLLTTLPVPDFPLPYLTLRKLVGETRDLGFVSRALEFAKLQMAEGNRNHMRQEFVFWSAVEYSSGQQLIARNWDRVHPGQAIPDQYARSHGRFMANDPTSDVYFNSLLAKVAPQADKRCSPDDVRRDFERDRIRYVRALEQSYNAATGGAARATDEPDAEPSEDQ